MPPECGGWSTYDSQFQEVWATPMIGVGDMTCTIFIANQVTNQGEIIDNWGPVENTTHASHDTPVAVTVSPQLIY